MKTLARILLGLVVIILVALVAVFFYIDSIARKAVETQATYALGVPTTLGKASVGLMAGRFDMNSLKVGNPPGFATPHLLTMKDGGVAVKLSSLRSDLVELPELKLSGIDVNLEKKGGDANYKVVLDHLKKTQGGDKPPPPDSGNQKKYIVRLIEIKDVNVHIDLKPLGGLGGDLTKLDVPLERIVLKDVGSDSAGVKLNELSGIVVQAIFQAVVKKAGDILPKELLGDLSGALAGLKDIDKFGMEVTTKALEQLGSTAGEVLKGAGGGAGEVGKAAEEAVKGLGGLLGGDKEKKK